MAHLVNVKGPYMKSFLGLFLICLFVSCQNRYNDEYIVVDLENADESILYSSFVDSVSYLTFHFGDNPIAGIEKIYKNEGYYYILGKQSTGIFIFDEHGNLYSHINSYGEGPEEFRMISSFSVVGSTGDVCILDYVSQQTKYYTKEGAFRKSVPCSDWSVDLASLSEECIIFISPFYITDNEQSGIWLADGQNQMIKQLSDDVTSDHRFYYYPMTYTISDTCFYYYDRNWDYLSCISDNGMKIMYRFDVKQKLPSYLMGNARISPSMLSGYAICDRFLYSSPRTLMVYCIFSYDGKTDTRSYVWAMFDNYRHVLDIAKTLYNDLDDVQIENHEYHHLDDLTWAVTCNDDADSFDICLQLLHLKNQ